MPSRPNLLVILADDHAAHAISAYGSRINRTPHIDRIAAGGMRFDRCFVTNSVCTPSRATILTGTYNHVNGATTVQADLDNRLPTYPRYLRAAGYQTALVGKWHLGHGKRSDPADFDHWEILPHQGEYLDPLMIGNGVERRHAGHVSDVITERSLAWLERRDPGKPFCLMVHHKAPHRPWTFQERYRDVVPDGAPDLPEPATLDDDYATRARAAALARMRMEHLKPEDLRAEVPAGLTPVQERHWRYQRYIANYVRCVAGLDDSVGTLLDWLDRSGLAQDTVVVYTSDQGFFLGDHGWFDKRFMYEESLRMPLLVRYPRLVPAGSVCTGMASNVDFAPTFLALAGLPVPGFMQGDSLVPLLRGEAPAGWKTAVYHRYWMNRDPSHRVLAHYGIRSERWKLIYYYDEDCGQEGAHPGAGITDWELFDCQEDPLELRNLYHDPACAGVVADLTARLDALQARIGDIPRHHPAR